MTVRYSDLNEELRGSSLSVWSYRTSEKGAALLVPDYWNAAASRLRLGDRIMCTCTGSAKVEVFTLAVVMEGKRKVRVAPECAPSVQ